MSTAPTIERWDEAEGVKPRGTLIVLAGRGEAASVYARFGRRLSADAYRVRAIRDISESPGRSALIVRRLIDEADALPVALVGSDAGALLALRIATDRRAGVTAIITAGLPSARGLIADEQAQLDARSACPVHRRVLTDPDAVDLTALARDLPFELARPRPDKVLVPVLALHGDADAVAPSAEAVAYYERLPQARIAIVAGGRHDILNDLSHRSVAATVILFLEQLRNDGIANVTVVADFAHA